VEFLEKIFKTTKLSERTWAKLVTLDTLNWYCDGLEPKEATRRYDRQVRKRKLITLAFLFFFLF